MNEIYNKYCLYLKYMCEVACAEQNIDFDSKFKELSSPTAKPTPQPQKQGLDAAEKARKQKEEQDRLAQQQRELEKAEQLKREAQEAERIRKEKEEKLRAEHLRKEQEQDQVAQPTTRLSFDDGYYVGETKNGLMHGKGTRYWFDNEKKWEGDWVNGVACGHIVVSFGDLVIYDGQMEKGLPNGEGTLLYPNTGERYVGHFVDYRRDGFGKLYTSEGLPVYEGEWKNDKQHGQGKSFLGGVCRYDGQWKDGKKSGKGTEFDAKGNVLFQGNWENDIRCK